MMNMKSAQIENCACKPEECDTFQFMAKKLNMSVLHPGGFQGTELLAKHGRISENMTVLDAGCGSGSSSIFLARKYGCKVVGIDIDQNSITKAYKTARKKGVLDGVAFRRMDISDLSFQDQTFDGAICQAALIFTEKQKALQTIHKKLRPGGFIGIIELAWKTTPLNSIVRRVGNTLCAAAVNTEQHSDWIKLLSQIGFDIEYTELRDLNFNFSGMLRNEGFFSTLRIALKCAFDKSAKWKTSEVTKLFKETQEYLGYGIYVGRKK
jgi:ubiquinone/menaquinone biosynthesis C-methylase UbiE